MAKFFKQETKKPLTYSSIVERKSEPNYAIWITGIVIIIVISFILYFYFK